ncbi:MAG: DinB family protein [Bacteroidota bacterium]
MKKNWLDQIDDITAAFTAQFNGLTTEELNWKPSNDVWSIAQNMDHLIVINESYFPLIQQLKSGTLKTPMLAKLGFVTNMFGKMILNASKPDRKKKIKTFPVWEPDQSHIANIVERFAAHQKALKSEIEASGKLIDADAVIVSPANKNIAYKLETAFDIIVVHEQRHLEQAKELQELMSEKSQAA